MGIFPLISLKGFFFSPYHKSNFVSSHPANVLKEILDSVLDFHLNDNFYRLVREAVVLEFSSHSARFVAASDPRFWRVGKCRALVFFGGELPIPIVSRTS